MEKEYASQHTYLGDSIVDLNTVLLISRVVAQDLPSRENILPNFMYGEENISKEESSLTFVMLNVR